MKTLRSMVTGLIALSVLWSAASIAQPSGTDPSAPPAAFTRIYDIHSVEIVTLKSNPPQYVLIAKGRVNSGGWTDEQLWGWVYIVPPADGVYSFDFVARPPAPGRIVTQVFVEKTAVLPLPQVPDLRGVRVHSATNSMVAMMGGKKEAKESEQRSPDYAGWIGKRLVLKGQQGDGPNVVREEDLPTPYRIFRPGQEIGDTQHNPNRLTLTLDDKGIIVALSWG